MGWTALWIYMVLVIIKSLLLPTSVDKYLTEALIYRTNQEFCLFVL